MFGRRAAPLAATALFIVAAGFFSEAYADEKFSIPSGRFGIAGAARQNIGELGESYGLGLLIGVEAGYQAAPERDWSLGINWTTLFRGWYFADDPSLIEQTVNVSEMSFGLRLQRVLSATLPRYIVVCGGGHLSPEQHTPGPG